MGEARKESYRANNCAGMALFVEEGLKSGDDQLGKEFAHKASASGILYYMGAYHKIDADRIRTPVAWGQAATAEYRVTVQRGNDKPRAIAFSTTTRPSELDREVVTQLTDMFPDFPAPAELI